MTILFVDDSPEFLKAMNELCTILRPDRKVICFLDAFEAMNFISQNHKDICGVITDHQMINYGMTGTIIVNKCREKEVPVYVCTGYSKAKMSYYDSNVSVIEKGSLEVLISTLKAM